MATLLILKIEVEDTIKMRIVQSSAVADTMLNT